jgi:hypothetical protein
MQDRTSVRELRKNLAAALNSGKVTVIGGNYELRAFVVSLQQYDRWAHAARTKALTAAKKAFLAAIKAELES